MFLSHHVKDWMKDGIRAACWILGYVGLVLLYHLVAGSTFV